MAATLIVAGGINAAAADDPVAEASPSPSDPVATEPVGRVSLAPPDIEGLQMDVRRFVGDGPRLQSEMPGFAAAFVPLVEALGADMESLSLYQVDSGGVNTAPGYQTYIAVRVEGAGGGELGPAFLAAFGIADTPGIELSDIEVAGKAVLDLRDPERPDVAAYLYDAGDTIYLLQMTPELAAKTLEALP